MNFDRDSNPIGAISRPGAQRSQSNRARPDNAPPINVDEVRVRLLEGAIFEAVDALQATADEAFDGLIKAIERLAGHGVDRVCPQCGRIGRLSYRGIGNDARLCSQTCQRFYDTVLPQPPPRHRRKASGAMI
jgi:hypothetical protein